MDTVQLQDIDLTEFTVNLKDMWNGDNSYYSHLDSTHWLTTVSEALKVALRIADVLVDGMTVVIKGYWFFSPS